MDVTPRAAGRTQILKFAGTLTATLLVGAAILGWFAHTGDCGATSTYSCMTAPDWGNFIAGIFAPIAFIWLVAAVWIQSQELAEQREELRLTRLEFEESRAVMKEQAVEARKQAEFIGLQTEILARQEQERIFANKRGNFSDLILELSGLVDQHFVHRAIIAGKPSGGGEGYTLFYRPKDPGSDRILIAFGEHLANDPHNYAIGAPFSFHPSSAERIGAANLLTGQIIALSEELGPAQKNTVARLELKRLKANIDALLDGSWPLK
jgi:hypothetical protein